MMSSFFRKWPLIIPLILLVGGCGEGNPKPDNLIPEQDYIDLLIELQLLESYRLTTPPDSTNIDSIKQVIYDKYGVNQRQFVASHRYYQRQIEPQKERIAKAIDSLKATMIKEGLVDSATQVHRGNRIQSRRQ